MADQPKQAVEKIPNVKQLGYFASLISDGASPHHLLADTGWLQLSATERVAELDYHGITLLALGHNKLDATVQAELNAAAGPRKAMMIANDALKKIALLELFEAFDAAGLSRTLMFKGTALAYSIYPHSYYRPRTDVDLLIDQARLADYQRVFEQLGYARLFAIEGEYISYQTTFGKRLTKACVINFDLHWRINNRQVLANAFTLDNLLDDGANFAETSTPIRVPSLIDSLLIASLHRLGHHSREERLIWLYDIHLLATRLTASEWQSLVDKALRKQLCAITADALLLCQQLFASPVSPQVVQQLSQSSTQGKREPSAIYLQRSLPEWRYFYQDLKVMPGVRQKFRLIAENVLPQPAYIRRQMQTRSALFGYLKRLWRGIKRIVS
jgi:hypothetical protein